MEIHLLTLAEWVSLLQHSDEREQRRGQFLLGTIVDVLQLAEGCKKGEVLDLAAFRAGWKALGEKPAGLLADGTLQCCGLDQDGLLDALFDWDRAEGEEGIEIWDQAADRTQPPWRTLRRLILRPTEQRYWDQGVYDAMEQLFGEEPDRNA
ncbi:MAG: hypothetical protein JO112_20505 [Planctomycetes bacterium]|nr:hypothetical protein [Planctomycetota bacterium]